MKLRVRIRRQTSRVELAGREPSVAELMGHIRETLLTSHGLSADADFSLSLNGSELLSDSGQTLSSCGIVSGDLICVVLPEPADASTTDAPARRADDRREDDHRPAAATTAGQVSCEPGDSDGGGGGGSPAAPTQSEAADPAGLGEPRLSGWEPMLCSEAEEGHAPLALELLYHSAQVTSPSDAVMVAAHRMMLETGFVPQVRQQTARPPVIGQPVVTSCGEKMTSVCVLCVCPRL